MALGQLSWSQPSGFFHARQQAPLKQKEPFVVTFQAKLLTSLSFLSLYPSRLVVSKQSYAISGVFWLKPRVISGRFQPFPLSSFPPTTRVNVKKGP